MKISEMKNNQIPPFEIEDEKMRKLLSFYIHYAPTIESNTAISVDENKLKSNWNKFFEDAKFSSFKIYNENYKLSEEVFSKNQLGDNQILNRKNLSVVCKRKHKNEEDYECILRHIRNSIAHNNIYIVNAGNRKYILLEDYNKSKNITSRMLLSQTILSKLKRCIIQ